MANRTYLIPHSSADPGSDNLKAFATLKAANYSLPILWIPLFRQANTASRTVEAYDGSGEATTMEFPTLHVSTAEALQNWSKHRAVLASYLPAELHSYLQDWKSALSSIRLPYIQVELSELAMMMAAEEFQEFLSLVLTALESQETGALREFFGQANLEFNGVGERVGYEEATVEYSLVGFEW